MGNHASLIRFAEGGKPVTRRGRNFIEFDNGDGSRRFVATIEPLHVRASETEIDATWYPDTGAWQWKIGDNDWQAHARDVFNVGSLIEWRHSSGEWVIVDPQSINWVNQDYSRQQIAIKQAVLGVANDATLTFANAYGPGRHFSYTAHPKRLIKHFTIDALANLPTPTVQGTIHLEVEWTITNSAGVELYLDGVAWARKNKTKVQTASRIEFKANAASEALWYADAPTATDANGETIAAQYEVEANGGVYFIRVRVPREWLLTAAYPVQIDPTFTDGYGGDVDTAYDTWVYANSSTLVSGAATNLVVRGASTYDTNTLILHALAMLEGASINSANLYLYQFAQNWGTDNSISYVHRILSANSGWSESCNWDYADGAGASDRWAGDSGSDGGVDAGCSVSGTDYSSTQMGSVTWDREGAVGTEYNISLDTTEFAAMVAANYGIVITCPTIWDDRANFCSSDHATTGYRPKLVIDYSTASTAQDTQPIYLAGKAQATDTQPFYLVGDPAGQMLRPDGDIAEVGSWTNQADGSVLYSAVDEASPSDTDYIQLTDPQVNDYFEVSLTNPSGIVGSGSHILRYRFGDIEPSVSVTLDIEVRQGGTTVATRSQTAVVSGQTLSFALTAGEIATITDYSDLRVRFTVTAVS